MTELLRGVALNKVDRKSLTRAVKSLKIACDTSIDSMVASLSDHLIKLHKADPAQLLRCDWCGGSSDITFDRCPYCGLDDAETTTKLAEEEAAKLTEQASAPPAEKSAVNAKPPKKTRSQAAAAAPSAPAASAKAKPAKGPGVKATKPAAIQKVHKGELVTTAALDDAVAEIKQIQINIADNHWLLGRKISEVHEQSLYKLRLDAAGVPKYKNFGQWVLAELEFSPRYALDLAAVSKVFTEAEIKEVGVTKLRVLARIPEEAKRANLVAAAKGELTGGKPLSRNQLTSEATKGGALPPRPTIDGRNVNEDSVAKRAEKAAARAAEKGVTVVIQPGRTTIPLFNGADDGDNNIRAFDVNDEPVGLEDTLNGLKIRYTLERDGDGLVLVIERTRG